MQACEEKVIADSLSKLEQPGYKRCEVVNIKINLVNSYLQ